MFQLPAFTHDRGLAVAFRLPAFDAESLDRPLGEIAAQFLADIHQCGQIVDELAREGIGDDGDGRGLACGGADAFAALAMGLFHRHNNFPDVAFHGRPHPIFCRIARRLSRSTAPIGSSVCSVTRSMRRIASASNASPAGVSAMMRERLSSGSGLYSTRS